MRISFLISIVNLLLLSQAFSQTEVTVECSESWGPGLYNKVTISIVNKNSDGVARFTQDFPVGFEIIADDSGKGDFSWVNDQLNIVWIKPDANPIRRFSYFIRPEKSMYGKITLSGKFVYITGRDTRHTILLKEKEISVGGTSGLTSEELNIINRQSENSIIRPINQISSSKAKKSGAVVFRVQVSVNSSDLSGDDLKKRLGIKSAEKVTKIKSGKMYKYQLGSFTEFDAAQKLLEELTSAGLKEAFVVAWDGDKQIPLPRPF